MPLPFDLLEPHLAISGYPETSEQLVGIPFDVILDVADFHKATYLDGLGDEVKVICCPFEVSQPAPVALLTAAVMELAALMHEGKRVLVHCQHGQSRSPTVVALYWMARDRMSWDEAIDCIKRIRPRIEPHPWLTDERTRNLVVRRVRSFLSGTLTALEESREAARKLLHAAAERPPEPMLREADWNLIDEGLGLGSYPQPLSDILGHFDRILNVAAAGDKVPYASLLPESMKVEGFFLRDDEPPNLRVPARILDRLNSWRTEGHRVYVHCQGGRSLSVLVVILYLMLRKGWDYGATLWFVRSRRTAASPRPGLFAGRSVVELVAACQEILGGGG